jgi:exonuclease III
LLAPQEKPLSVRYGLGIPSLDAEGRLITAEFEDFFVVSGYIPNSGDGLKRLEERTQVWDPALAKHLKVRNCLLFLIFLYCKAGKHLKVSDGLQSLRG